MPFLLFVATSIVTYTSLKLYKDFNADSTFAKSAIEKFKLEKTLPNDINTTQNNLTIASLSLFFMSIGSMFYLPFLLFISVIGIIYTTISIWQNGYHSIVKERQVNWSVVESVAFPWLLLSGYYFLTALLNWLSWLTRGFISEFKILGQDLRRSLFKAFGKLPTVVWLEKNGIELEIQINTLTIGDIIVVNTGEIVPVDGIIIDGNAYINQYLLTGKSQLIAKSSDDQIFASNVVTTGRILVKAEKWGVDTVIAKNMSMYGFRNRFYDAW